MKDERRKEIIAQLDEKDKDRIKQFEKRAEKSLKELLTTFCQIYDKDKVEQGYGDDTSARIDYSLRAVKSRVATEVAREIEDIEIYVNGKRDPSTGERDDGSQYTVSSCMGIASLPDRDRMKLVSITGWGDAANVVNRIEHEDSYSIRVEKQDEDRNYAEYEFGSFSDPKSIDFDPDNETVKKVLKRHVDVVKIADAKQYADGPRSEKYMVKGIIQDIQMMSTANGKMGRIEVYDDSVPLSNIEEKGLFPVMCPYNMVKYGPDSEVLFIGNITDSEEYGVGMFADAAIPLIPIEYQDSGTSVEESEMEVEDANAPAVAEVDDEEVEEGDKFDELL